MNFIWSIGLKGSDDQHAKIVANHLKTIHHEICLTEQQLLDAIESVIYDIESYDTTVRASVPNWLICKYIEQSTQKLFLMAMVVMN